MNYSDRRGRESKLSGQWKHSFVGVSSELGGVEGMGGGGEDIPGRP